MSQSIAWETRWPIGLPQVAGQVANHRAVRGGAGRPVRRIAGLLDDAVFLLLAVLMVPVAIVAVATPLALFVRRLLEIAKRM